MNKSNNKSVINNDAIAIETVIITILWLFIAWGSEKLGYIWIFRIAVVLVLSIIAIRTMASRSKEPNITRIKRTVRWSSAFLQLAIIGAFSAISIWISDIVGFQMVATVFTILSLGVVLSMFLLDELLLGGGLLDAWEHSIKENVGNEVIRGMLTNVFGFAKNQLRGELHQDEAPELAVRVKAISMAILFLFVIFLISIPILFILSNFFGGKGTAFLIVLSLFFIRDISRGIYLNYGAASSFDDLRWKLRWEFAWFIFRGGLIAVVLDYFSGSSVPTIF